jgi:hypothetical protein
MAMQQSFALSSQPNQRAEAGTQFLRRVLLGNALFSALTGLLLIVDASLITPMLHAPARVLTVLGVIILLAAAELAWLATRPQLDLRWVKFILVLDCTWVAVSVAVLMTGLLPLTTGGKWAVGIVADMVTLFAVLEFLGLRRLATNQDNL